MNLRALEEQLGNISSSDTIDNNCLSSAIGAIAAATQTYEEKMACARMLKSIPPAVSIKPVHTVGLFCSRLGNGGIERTVTLLLELFSEMGYKAVVVTDDGLDDDSYKLPETVVHEKLCSISSDDSVCDAAAKRAAALIDIIERYEIDVFMNHAWLDSRLLYDLMVCHARGVRFVMCVHGVFSFAELLPGHMRDSFALVPLICRLCDAVVTLTDMNAFFYSKFCPSTYAIPNPIDKKLQNIACEKRNCSHSGAEVLWVGRFDALKRPEEAIEAFARMQKSFPRAHLTLVGKSEDGAYEQLLIDRCSKLGIENSVTFAGYTTDVAAFYKQADVLISTSEVEGFCMVLLEASAAMLPIVMYRLPYLPFDRSEGVLGVPIGDVEALANSILMVLRDEKLREKMKSGALKCFESFGSYDYKAAWQRVFDGLEKKPVSTSSSLEEPMWDVLFDHYVKGSEAIRREQNYKVNENCKKLEEEIREEYESSISYRLGRAFTSLPRHLLGR